MSISVTDRKVPYAGNGATTRWPITFPLLEASHIGVIITNTDGIDTMLATNEFQVLPTLDYVDYPLSGGTVLPTGWKITLVRTVPYTQETDLGTRWPFDSIEDISDKLTMQVQQLAEEVNRAVKVGMTSTISPDQLITEIRTGAVTASISASTAAAAADTATTKADEAAASEGIATTKAGEAAASADTATTKAATATTKASEAAASADTATTKAATATTKAGEAAASADTATTKAGEAAASADTATTKAGEAANSASAAAISAAAAAAFDPSTASVLSASKLTTARKISGINFDGSGDINIPYSGLTGKPTISTSDPSGGSDGDVWFKYA